MLITHEHKDHLHTDSLVQILKNNPSAKVITNSAVGKLLEEIKINYTKLEGEDATEIADLKICARDSKHEEICGNYGMVQNTGYFIDGKLYYPGDSYSNPGREVPILALPVAGP